MIHFSAYKKIKIRNITAIMTVKIAEKRPDIACLIENLENDNLSKGERANLSVYLESLGLLKYRRLTKEGEIARDNYVVLIPESGVYNIYLVKYPVPGFESGIIHFKRIEPRDILDGQTVSFEEFSEYDNPFCTSWYSNDKFEVHFERPGNEYPRVIDGNPVVAEVHLKADTESVSLTIQLAVPDGGKYIQLEKNEVNFSGFSLEENIYRLIEGWDSKYQALKMTFQEAQKRNILSSFRTDESLSHKILAFTDGNDEDQWNVIIESIPVIPRSDPDAEEWIYELASSELERNIGYCSSLICLEVAKDIHKKSPIYPIFSHLTLSANEMKEYIKGKQSALSEYVEIADDLYPEQFIAN